MTRYIARTDAVEAALYDGQLVGDPDPARPGKVIPGTCPEWFPAVIEEKGPHDHDWKPGSICTLGGKIYIATEDATYTVKAGGWFLRGPSGRIYTMSSQQFERQFMADPADA